MISTACLATVRILNRLEATGVDVGQIRLRIKGKLAFVLSMAKLWQERGIRKKDKCVYVYICVYACVRVCLGVYILQKKCRKNKTMMGLQETVTYVDPLSALPFFEC